MTLSPDQITAYERDGFLVLENFVDDDACDRLQERAEELVRDFDPAGVVSIFSTHEQTRTSDDYFLESGDKIRFFFEENAFLSDGSLRQSKERSINKIGHALPCGFHGLTSSLAVGMAARRVAEVFRKVRRDRPCNFRIDGRRAVVVQVDWRVETHNFLRATIT